MELTDILGYAAATLTTASFVPQVWRTFRTKDVSGISLKMYSIFTLGIAVWLAYGIVLGEVPMMIANSLSLVMACAVLVMKVRYGRLAKKAREGGRSEGGRGQGGRGEGDRRERDKSRMARA